MWMPYIRFYNDIIDAKYILSKVRKPVKQPFFRIRKFYIFRVHVSFGIEKSKPLIKVLVYLREHYRSAANLNRELLAFDFLGKGAVHFCKF